MADSILRLKVESQEYDNKLKRATEGLTRYIDGCRKIGGTLEQVEKETIEYVRSLGQMETTSRTATGRLNEMKKTFVDLSVQYKSLTDAEKSAPFGQGIAESLDQLKPRILNAKKELDDINKSLDGGGGGLLAGLGDKMSGALQVFGGNLMTKGAGMLAGLANEMGEMVKEGIELAKQGEGIRIAFERLNRPDILDGLREATHGTVTDLELMKAAVKFNDFKLPLDQMGTLLAFAQQKAKDTGQSIDYLVESIVTGLGRQSLMILDNLGLSASEIRERMKETGDMTSAVADIIREQMAAAGDYVETAADRATQADVELKNAMEDLGRTLLPLQQEGASAFTGIETAAINALNSGVAPLIPKIIELKSGISELYTSVSESSVFRGMVNWMKTGIDVTSRWIPLLKILRGLMQGNAAGSGASLGASIGKATAGYQEVENIGEVVVTGNSPARRTGRGGSRGGSRGGFDVSRIAFDPNKAALAAVKAPEIEGGSEAWKTMREAIAGCKEEMADYSAETANWTKNFDPYRENMEKMTKAAKQQQMAFNMGAEAANNLGAAFSQMEDPAARAAGTVIQAISSIALGFAMASVQAGALGPIGWIAWLAAGTAALATTISTIHSLTGYANGGVIKGNSYSGDNIGGMVDGGAGGFVGLNAGEVVLNAAQQRGVASALSEGGNRRIEVFGRLSGETIYLSSDRYTRRTGRGTIMTWK